jgi:hypothetical protein
VRRGRDAHQKGGSQGQHRQSPHLDLLPWFEGRKPTSGAKIAE